PARLVRVPEGIPRGDPYNVGQLYHAFALPAAEPGSYRLRITVIDLITQQHCTRTVDFEIIKNDLLHGE
ncbi:hypothetical protein HUU05_24645, partial [candidate division KSB1 bacterium]|nr:hypothetical protein [candidate division KSB1 bacterium]